MYQARHLSDKKYLKHSKQNKYYTIFHPLEKNKTTGNACVSIDDVAAYDKDFIFQYIGDDDKLKSVVVDREIVKKHLQPCMKNVKDEDGNVISHKFFYMINLFYVFDYGKEIEI